MSEQPEQSNTPPPQEPKTQLDNLKTILSQVDGPASGEPVKTTETPPALDEMIARSKLEQALVKLQDYPGPQMSFKELKSLLEPFLGPLQNQPAEKK